MSILVYCSHTEPADTAMLMREAKKGLRVKLSDAARKRYTLGTDAQIDLGRSMLIPRDIGTLRSGRVIAPKRPYEEGLVVYVMWDGLRSPEAWHLIDLTPAVAS